MKHGTLHPDHCPECGGALILGPSKYGPYYACEYRNDKGCKGSACAHPDGRPQGTAVGQRTKWARGVAHKAFDDMRKRFYRDVKRNSMYGRLADAMGMTRDECHMAKMSFDQCMQVVVACAEMVKGEQV